MTEQRHDLTPTEVWNLVEQGVNANEIAAYCGVSQSAAAAMIVHATRLHARLAA